MRARDGTCLALALLAGGLAAFVDMHATEVQPAVLTLIVTGAPIGFARPRLWWLWGIVAGGCVPLGYAVAALVGAVPRSWPEPNILASALAIFPALIGTGLGALLARGKGAPAAGAPTHGRRSRDD